MCVLFVMSRSTFSPFPPSSQTFALLKYLCPNIFTTAEPFDDAFDLTATQGAQSCHTNLHLHVNANTKQFSLIKQFISLPCLLAP